MLSYLYTSLATFRDVFPRKTTWLKFCMIALGFIGASEMVGITSFCRFWGGGAAVYNALDHFFRSSGWSAVLLAQHWMIFALSQNLAVYHGPRIVLLGDHTCVPKDGRRMPGVVTLHQNSETQSRPSYFRGHYWAAVGMLVGSWACPFCIPLILALHSGFIHIGEESGEENHQTLKTRMILMALEFCVTTGKPVVLILDAFFPSGAVFQLANSVWSIALREPMVSLIIKAKKTALDTLFPAPCSIKAKAI